ncbi:hypothetical protein D3C71_2043590 [compost metagenome]
MKEGETLKLRVSLLMSLNFIAPRNCLCSPGSVIHVGGVRYIKFPISYPLTLLALAYAGDSTQRADQLMAQVRQELETVL